MSKTIEQHYNFLKSRADVLESRRKGNMDGFCYIKGEDFGTDYRYAALQTVCRRATELAAEDWARVRRDIAALGLVLPEGPLTYKPFDDGYSITIPYGRTQSNRSLVSDVERRYLDEAVNELQTGEWTREAERAMHEWECYRQAVAQGVAIPPSE